MQDMAMVAKTNRWDPDAWDLISRAASLRGVSAGEFVRVAAEARAAFTIAALEPELVEHWERLYELPPEALTALRAIIQAA